MKSKNYTGIFNNNDNIMKKTGLNFFSTKTEANLE